MTYARNLLVVTLATFALACGDDDGGGDSTYSISFAATVGSEAAACGTSYDNIGTGNATVELKDLRFYVSNVRLLDGTTEVPLALADDGTWQDGTVGLVDLEDGTGGCDMGTSATNDTIMGTAATAEYTGVVFDLAVPFAQNHLDVAAAEAPLDNSAMYWAWAIGYKFMRVDFDVNSGAARWNVHIGSHMCVSDAMDQPPAEECARPNRAEIRLTSFNPMSDTIKVDVNALVANSDLMANTTDTAFGCQSFPNDATDCGPVFTSLGLDFASGGCTGNCANQSVFSVE